MSFRYICTGSLRLSEPQSSRLQQSHRPQRRARRDRARRAGDRASTSTTCWRRPSSNPSLDPVGQGAAPPARPGSISSPAAPGCRRSNATAPSTAWTGPARRSTAARSPIPAMRAQIMALRYDPRCLGADGGRTRQRQPRRAHRRAGPRARCRRALSRPLPRRRRRAASSSPRSPADPGHSAAALLPKAAAANRTIFYDAGGAPRSVAEVMELLRGKVSRARWKAAGCRDAGVGYAPPDRVARRLPASAAAAATGGPIARQFMPPPARSCRAAAAARRRWPRRCATAFGVSGGDGRQRAGIRRAPPMASLQRFGL